MARCPACTSILLAVEKWRQPRKPCGQCRDNKQQALEGSGHKHTHLQEYSLCCTDMSLVIWHVSCLINMPCIMLFTSLPVWPAHCYSCHAAPEQQRQPSSVPKEIFASHALTPNVM